MDIIRGGCMITCCKKVESAKVSKISGQVKVNVFSEGSRGHGRI